MSVAIIRRGAARVVTAEYRACQIDVNKRVLGRKGFGREEIPRNRRGALTEASYVRRLKD